MFRARSSIKSLPHPSIATNDEQTHLNVLISLQIVHNHLSSLDGAVGGIVDLFQKLSWTPQRSIECTHGGLSIFDGQKVFDVLQSTHRTLPVGQTTFFKLARDSSVIPTHILCFWASSLSTRKKSCDLLAPTALLRYSPTLNTGEYESIHDYTPTMSWHSPLQYP